MALVRGLARSFRRALYTSQALANGAETTLEDVVDHEAHIGQRLFETFLKLEEIDQNIYRGVHLLRGRNSQTAVYGGQVVGHALSAANRTVEEDFVPHSLHSYFIKAGHVTKPILYMVDRPRDGKSFCTRGVKAIQNGEVLFTAQVSYHKPEKDSMKHSVDAPPEIKAGPDGLLSDRELIRTMLEEDEKKPEAEQMKDFYRNMLEFKMLDMPPSWLKIFESRPVNTNLYKFLPDAKPMTSMWIRALEPIGTDYNLQRALAAYISDAQLLEAAVLPHVGRGLMPAMVFTLDHAIWFHQPNFHVDDWLLYQCTSSFAGGARAFTAGRLWTRDGQLVLSCTQEGLVRAH